MTAMYISNYPPQRDVDRLALEIYSSDARIPMWKAYIMARLRLRNHSN